MVAVIDAYEKAGNSEKDCMKYLEKYAGFVSFIHTGKLG